MRGTAGCLPDTQQLTVARCQVFHLTPQQKAPVGEFHVLQILTRFATSATISTAQWQLPSIVNRDCKQIKNPKPFLFLKLIICKYCYSTNPSNLYFWFGSFPTKKGSWKISRYQASKPWNSSIWLAIQGGFFHRCFVFHKGQVSK